MINKDIVKLISFVDFLQLKIKDVDKDKHYVCCTFALVDLQQNSFIYKHDYLDKFTKGLFNIDVLDKINDFCKTNNYVFSCNEPVDFYNQSNKFNILVPYSNDYLNMDDLDVRRYLNYLINSDFMFNVNIYDFALVKSTNLLEDQKLFNEVLNKYELLYDLKGDV